VSDTAITRSRFAGWSIGYYGKLPVRGDFVHGGLPRVFVRAWDDWIVSVLPGARELLSDEWQAAWMEAPIWRFILPAGMCGDQTAIGVWMPSVDRVGRQFPFVLAACIREPLDDAREDIGFFLACTEQAGLAALNDRLAPEAITSEIVATKVAAVELPSFSTRDAVWWTDGSPFVHPTEHRSSLLPDRQMFASMLSDRVKCERGWSR
jgi:type VI secretion system protein ImpM